VAATSAPPSAGERKGDFQQHNVSSAGPILQFAADASHPEPLAGSPHRLGVAGRFTGPGSVTGGPGRGTIGLQLREGTPIGDDWDMSLMIWIGVGSTLAVAVGIWALVRRGGAADVKDLGSISGQWMAEQRFHEREVNGRWG
jgi:hypothetical protein